MQKEYLDANQPYAGGAQATFHDDCAGWTLLTVARPGYWASSGSMGTLNMSFLKHPKLRDFMRLECKV
jgi:hypothetical protein